MKKLRPSNEDKVKLIEDITERLAWLGHKSLSEFDIKDLIEERCKIPENIQKPTIKVEVEAYMKMLELVNQSDVECSWHGMVARRGNEYWIYDILVFPQINSATSTTTDEKEFAEWQTKLIIDPEFPIENLRLHGHSHVNMNVFSSGIDDQYQKDLIAKVDDGDYYIFFIMNKKMEICMFLYDFEQQIMFETNDINFQITCKDEDIRKWAKDELKENATTERTSYYRGKNYYQQEDFDYGYSYFSKVKPIFKGGTNGSK